MLHKEKLHNHILPAAHYSPHITTCMRQQQSILLHKCINNISFLQKKEEGKTASLVRQKCINFRVHMCLIILEAASDSIILPPDESWYTLDPESWISPEPMARIAPRRPVPNIHLQQSYVTVCLFQSLVYDWFRHIAICNSQRFY